MAWVTPKTWSAGEALTASDFNTYIRDNFNALKVPPSQNYEANEGTDYTTSSTNFADIDAGTGANTKFRRDITTTGGDILVGFHGSFYGAVSSSTPAIYLDVTLDGTRQGGDDGILVLHAQSSLNLFQAGGFVRLLTPVSAGTHTLKIQWKVANISTATLYAGAGTSARDVHPQFWVREVS